MIYDQYDTIYRYIYFSDEDVGLEDLARCTVPNIESHSKSVDLNTESYQKVLQIFQKESGPRFSLMKEDMDSVKECDKGKSYRNLLEKHIRKFFCNLCLGI